MKTLVLFSLTFSTLALFAQTIQFEQNVRIKKENQSVFEEIKAGEKIKMNSSENIFVVTEKSLPILILSPTSKSSNLSITDANLSGVMQEQLKSALNLATNEVVNELRKAETLIQKKDYSQALSGITEIRNKYSGISSVYFMSGTLYYLLNNRNSAIEELEKGLKIEPTHDSAVKLLAKLKAGG